MKYEQRFSRPVDAVKASMFFNGPGVRLALKQARQARCWSLETFRMLFSFIGIEGYPVTVFHDLMKRKGLAVDVGDTEHVGLFRKPREKKPRKSRVRAAEVPPEEVKPHKFSPSGVFNCCEICIYPEKHAIHIS